MTRMRMAAVLVGGCAALGVALGAAVPTFPAAQTASGAGAGAGAGADEARFPHARHVGLFPSCNGCHGGVLAADTTGVPLTGAPGTSLYPSPQQCAGCHDGTKVDRVSWDGPRREPSNLRFSHPEHNREADLGDPALNCGRCHQQRDSTAFMAVAEAQPEPCIGCHAHAAPAHLAEEARCGACHVPVARAVALSAEQIRAFRHPSSHERPDFAWNHAPTAEQSSARCAMCHARESCARCHANAADVPQIAALAPDRRLAMLVANVAPAYAAPASHRRAEWSYGHGSDARSGIARCANCHTQPGCQACHTGRLASETIARLPAGDANRGVRLRGHDPAAPQRIPPGDGALFDRDRGMSNGNVVRSNGGRATPERAIALAVQAQDTGRRNTVRNDSARAVRVHPSGFATRHGAAAATDRVSCSGCHDARRFCTDCHEGAGAGSRRFHPANFVVRHPLDAYARQRDCSSCHSREGFCAACHRRVGLGSEGRRDVAYHTAQPLWLIQHGRAARQGLESCTTCHVQRDCMQCHSQTGWSVNPHGPGFDARRMASRNAQTCRACHFGDPLAGRR